MLSRDKILKETSPISIFLVKSGCGGNRLLFRFPYKEDFQDDPELAQTMAGELPIYEQDRVQFQSVINEDDEALCNMFSVNPNLCGQKFEIKINSVRHVGHPMSLLPSTSSDSSTLPIINGPRNKNQGDITSFNIVCALRSSASYDIVDCYHDLSKRLAIALSFEERRCSYLSREIKAIVATLEERDMANLAERDQQNEQRTKWPSDSVSPSPGEGPSTQLVESVFSLILNRSQLARDLKRVFVSLSTTGIVDLKINNWISVSFCLPQKVHRLKLMSHKSMPAVSTKDIKRCLLFLRPYHGLLLLQEQQELLDSLPIDASPAFIQLIRVTKPDKNFMDLSVDANLTLMQIFCIVSQLIYWAKATVIYPICDSNIYAIHPLATTGTKSELVNDFSIRFPHSKSLHHYLAEFSEGTSLSQLNGPLLNLEEKVNLLNIVTWLLQRRILIQVHKYIFLVVEKEEKSEKTTISVANCNSNSNNSNSNNNSTTNNRNPNETMDNGLSDSSPQMFKSSLSESLESSMRRYRADSLAESQEDSNFCLNSSLSSTPNSNMEYPSPSSCPLDNPLNSMGNGLSSVMSALQKFGLSQLGAKVVLGVPASRNSDDMRLFIRLIPYFDGKHHIEDIMFFENLERSQILILCDKFRDILLTCHYEDVAVSQLSPFTSVR